MRGIIGIMKGVLVGNDRDELSLAGSYKAMALDAMKMNKLLLEEMEEMRSAKATSIWDLGSQFLSMPPEAQKAIIGQMPDLLKGFLQKKE